MPQVKDMRQQAEKLLKSRHLELKKKSGGSKDAASKIRSISTFLRYTQALGQAGKWAFLHHGIRRLDRLTPDVALSYLQSRIDEGISQKQLDNDRVSMQFVVGKLERLKSFRPQILTPRAYTAVQTHRIAARQADHNGLATKIAYDAGLRAHELHTIRRADEAVPTRARQWRDDLFHGKTGRLYVVTGKGGLTRQVLLNHELAGQLEARRFEAPQFVQDRGIRYLSLYDVGGGQAWSASFSKASTRELGWSSGGHGVRHAFAQDRLQQLLRLGYKNQDAMQLVSQELGHFRESVVSLYLR